ncbi:MAG: pyridoxamine 5'-phosphate oxidase family protein [Deltaproteobacteria bacterium]|nr:pyridoxamine 5'-phosphate oxidase family protein [Deltaproteobacteria bacterium]
MNKLQKTQIAPNKHLKTIEKLFSSNMFPAYGQLATVTENNIPQVRTVHFRYLKAYQELMFPTHIESQKWHQLKNKTLSGCYFSSRHLIQVRWEATPIFVDQSITEHQNERNIVWKKMRKDIKRAYWTDFNNEKGISPEEFKINSPCPSMGIIICNTYAWDIWKLNATDYSKSKRFIYRLIDGEWHATKSSPLYSKTKHNNSDWGKNE